ncbi:MAG: hypothetical protein IT585_01980 [candidate division Zixibacteria bacterium]|nr:hypothetical protein [candidate division Zixibacteria bacterium]
MTINLYTGWIGIFAACLVGMITGLFFHKEDFLGGYGSWPRRLMRLGHVALVGLGLINLAFVFTVRSFNVAADWELAAILLVVGTIAMPVNCYAAAFYRPARHLFFIPVLSVAVSAVITIWRVVSLTS